eukprot:CAMPEP_0184487130 /NCGR_PEP_ID=MMETSP0113_2-20130426/9294_1 /TAXON_ID=91329 /ORGANISM="Norrisiella sphaerica, Strain BC52" /LENGTH=218 /DNA_ID=CAMNT_0026869317 /DNA_START=121 /DNA_END=777 /DNA_ORIENTATION=+
MVGMSSSRSNSLGSAPSAITSRAGSQMISRIAGSSMNLDRPDMCAWAEEDGGRRGGRGGPRGRGGRGPRFEEKVLQVRRITKVVKGGKNMGFRALVAVGDKNGRIGLGCASAKEVMVAVEKASIEAKKTAITVPITKDYTLPHRLDVEWGAAQVMMKPASEGTGLVAGGAVRTILELAGYQNARGKQLGTDNTLNNAKAVLEAFKSFDIEKIKANGLV